MIEMNDDEIKQVQIALLREFKRFCEKNQLHYYLAYGTLIGAIRHKGFIPWDDDIDVMMPRADYDFLIRHYNILEGNDFEVVDPLSKKARLPYAKLLDRRTVKYEYGVDYSEGTMGIDIDIFPLDGQPENDFEFLTWEKKLRRHYKFYNYFVIDLKQCSVIKKLGILVLKVLLGGKEKELKRAYNLHSKYSFSNSKYVGVLESLYDEGNRALKECYENYILAEFEGEQYRIPEGYDQILRNIYGNFMVLPPKEEQVNHHLYKCYWK